MFGNLLILISHIPWMKCSWLCCVSFPFKSGHVLISHSLSSLNLSTTMKHKVSKRVISLKWVPFLCISFFALGAIFTSRSLTFHLSLFYYNLSDSILLLVLPFFFFAVWFFLMGFCFCCNWLEFVDVRSWEPSSDSGSQLISQHHRDHELQIVSDDCAHNKVRFFIQFCRIS